MFDVPQYNSGLQTAVGDLTPNIGVVNKEKQPIRISKAENGFVAQLDYMNVQRVYNNIDDLLSDLKVYFEEKSE